jgi:hypothetical protein
VTFNIQKHKWEAYSYRSDRKLINICFTWSRERAALAHDRGEIEMSGIREGASEAEVKALTARLNFFLPGGEFRYPGTAALLTERGVSLDGIKPIASDPPESPPAAVEQPAETQAQGPRRSQRQPKLRAATEE